MIDEMNMNILEDYKFFVKAKLQSKEYIKERQEYLCREDVMEEAKKEDKQDEIAGIPAHYYAELGAEELDEIIVTNLMP